MQPDRRRILIMDVDIVFVGPVLDLLEEYTEDFVVNREEQPAEPSGRFSELYFSLPKLREWNPTFVFPRYSFNAGQFVGTTGILKKEDFDGLIKWDIPRTVLKPEIFNRSDQGVLNYVVMSKHAVGALSLARVPFMTWNPEEMRRFELARLNQDSPYRQLIHWAGLRRPKMRDIPRADILLKFEQLYYSRVPGGAIKQQVRPRFQSAANVIQKVRGKLFGRQPRLYLT